MTDSDIPCSQIVELVTDYDEGALPEEAVRLFEQHLASCAGCTRYLEQIRVTVVALGAATDETLPDSAWDELRDAFGNLPR